MEESRTYSSAQEVRKYLITSSSASYIEVDFENSCISWMSESLLHELGYEEHHLKLMTLYDLVSKEFHDGVNNIVHDGVKGKAPGHNIWPIKTSNGQLIWFYSIQESISYHKDSLVWYRIFILGRTDRIGLEYSNMLLNMNMISIQNELRSRSVDQYGSITSDIRDIKNKQNILEKESQEIRQRFIHAGNAIEKAVSAALKVSGDMNSMKTEFREELSKQTTEIMRLINVDSQHDARIQSFNSKVNEAAENAVTKAVEEITKKSQDASTEITIKAGNAGRTIAKKVTIPVGVLAVVTTVVQWLLANWSTITGK